MDIEKLSALADYLGAWLKELIFTIQNTFAWLEKNFGGSDEEEA